MVEVNSADLAALAAGATGSVNLAAMVAGLGFCVNFMRLAEAFTFSDATLISCAVVVGDDDTANRFLTSTELASVGANVKLKSGALDQLSQAVYTAAKTVIAAFTGTAGKNLNSCTAGKLLLFCSALDARAGTATQLQ